MVEDFRFVDDTQLYRIANAVGDRKKINLNGLKKLAKKNRKKFNQDICEIFQ